MAFCDGKAFHDGKLVHVDGKLVHDGKLAHEDGKLVHDGKRVHDGKLVHGDGKGIHDDKKVHDGKVVHDVEGVQGDHEWALMDDHEVNQGYQVQVSQEQEILMQHQVILLRGFLQKIPNQHELSHKERTP